MIVWVSDFVAIVLIVGGWVSQRYAKKHQGENETKTHPGYYISAACFLLSMAICVFSILWLHLY